MWIERFLLPLMLLAPEGEDGGGASTVTGGEGGEGGGVEDAMGSDADAATGTEGAETLAGGEGGDDAAAGGEAAAWPDKGFPEDWRSRMIDGLPPEVVEKLNKSKRLDRAKSPQDVLRSIVALDSTVGDMAGRVKIPTGKSDNAKDVETFRKTWGVPEEPTKYEVWRPEGAGDMVDSEKASWDEFLPAAHEANFNQRQMDVVAKALNRMTERAMAELTAKAEAAKEEAQEALRIKWIGKDYSTNMKLTENWLAQKLPSFVGDGQASVLDKPFADGTSLRHHPEMIEFFHSLAAAEADDGTFLQGETTEGMDVDKKIDQLIGLKVSAPAEYRKKETQDELVRLLEVQARRNNKAA